VADALLQIRWRSLADVTSTNASQAGSAVEHCALKDAATGATLEGVAIPADPLSPALRYRIVTDAEWAGLRSVHLTIIGGATLALRHDGYGAWTDGEGKPRKDLQGVADVWIDGSPALLMAMLKRLGGKAGKSVKVDVARADPASFSVTRATVEVACKEAGRLWVVTPEGGAAEEIAFGADGILLRWGTRLERASLPQPSEAAA
jgi:hypothetical protein